MSKTVGEKIADRVTISFTPLNKRDMEKSIQNSEFTSVVGLVNTAIRFYFENRNKTDEFKKWLVSEDGEHYIKDLIRKVKDEK